jgi:hypothetical protein
VTPRRVLVLSTALLIGVGAAASPGAGAAPGGGGCQLSGTAKFVKGPNSTAHPFTYTFSGSLTNCHDDSGGPASGAIATLGKAKGSGTCQNGTTTGVALARWADRKTTVIKYSTTAYGAEVVLQGSVLKRYKLGRTTYRSTRYAGDQALANLVFEADPTQCAGSGVTSAGIAGIATLGHQ